MSTEFDVVVVGAGVVGLLSALALGIKVRGSKRIALIDPMVHPVKRHSAYDWGKTRRVSAINYKIFHQLASLLPREASLDDIARQFKGMAVFGPECGGSFCIDANTYKKESLAYVMANDELAALLVRHLPQQVTTISATVSHVTKDVNGYQLMANGETIRTTNLVAADGAQSKIRALLGIEFKSVGAESTAISAQLSVPGLKNPTWGHQWFLRDGSILGLLPVGEGLDSKPLMSMVWSLPGYSGDLSRSLCKTRLLAMLNRTEARAEFEGFDIISDPVTWPLRRGYVVGQSVARHYPGLYLVGDAAHVIHPLAGQGLNLGIVDALELTRTLSERGGGQLLSASKNQFFYCKRAIQIQAMLRICEGLKTHFEESSWINRGLGAFAFRTFDRHAALKSFIVRQMSF